MLVNRFKKSLGQLSNAIGVDLSKFYSQAKTQKITVGTEKVELIPGSNDQEASPRSWSISNQGPGTIWLFVGTEEIPSFSIAKKDLIVNNDSGGLGNRVSAIADTTGATVIVTLQGNFAEEGDNEMPLPLVVQPFGGTNEKRPTKLSGLFSNAVTLIGQAQIDNLFDSDYFIDGWKFFELASFQPGQEYTFKVKAGQAIDNLQLPVTCYALDPLKDPSAIFEILFNQVNPANVSIQSEAWRFKSWTGRTHSLPGEFTITPNGSLSKKYFGLWATDTNTGYENGLVWDFDHNTNEFTLLGF